MIQSQVTIKDLVQDIYPAWKQAKRLFGNQMLPNIWQMSSRLGFRQSSELESQAEFGLTLAH
jgi:hypothetical protein